MAQIDTHLDDAKIARGRDWLAMADLRPTKQRLSLAALLVGDGEDRHVTAEALHAASRDAGESVSLATVYNTLRAFCGAGLMQEVHVEGAKSYFDTRTDDHPHFLFEEAGSLVDCAPQDLEIARLPEPPEGHEIVSVDVIIRVRKR